MGSLKLSHCVQELVGIKRAEYGVGVDSNLAATVAEEEFNRTDGKKQLAPVACRHVHEVAQL